MLTLPLWAWSPDWSERVTETLAWKTDILASPTGAEQRIARRLTPRRQFEFSVLVGGAQRQMLEVQLALHGATTWALPLFMASLPLSQPLMEGQTVIPLPAASLRLSGISAIALQSAGGHAVCPVIATHTDSVTVGALSQAWPVGTVLSPVVPAMLTEPPPITRYSDDLMRLQCRFRVQQANPFPSTAPDVVYRGDPVLMLPSDWTQDRQAEYQRVCLELDNGTGQVFRTDTAARPFYLARHHWTVNGFEAQVALRQQLMALRGRQRAVWVSTQNADLTPLSMSGSQLVVQHLGVSTLTPSLGWRDIAVHTLSGVTRYYRVTDLRDGVMGTQLTVDGILPPRNSVASVHFLVRCRQHGDEITWVHHTDGEGVAEVSTVFRGVKDEL
ncbi:hypothetical protein ACF1CY_000728 [Providencia rettgeri]